MSLMHTLMAFTAGLELLSEVVGYGWNSHGGQYAECDAAGNEACDKNKSVFETVLAGFDGHASRRWIIRILNGKIYLDRKPSRSEKPH